MIDSAPPGYLPVRNTRHVMREPLFIRGWMARCAAISVRILGVLLLAASPSAAQDAGGTAATAAEHCSGDNGGITLPPGFCATVFADNVGHARQKGVAPNGGGYVNTWSGTYYRHDTPPPPPFLPPPPHTTPPGRPP